MEKGTVTKAIQEWFTAQMSHEDAQKIDWDTTNNDLNRKHMCLKFLMKMNVKGEEYWKLLKSITRKLEIAPLTISCGPPGAEVARHVKCKAEVAPEKRPASQAAGKAIGTLRRAGIRDDRMAKPEWGPFKWYATYDHAGQRLPRPRLLITWSEAKGYYLDKETLALAAPAAVHGQVMEKLLS